jgi:hypothetical protein
MNEDTSVRYIDRSREYYAAHGYETPYEWAHFDSIPFAPLRKPLAECTVTIVTTAMPDSSYVKENRRLSIGDLHDPPAALFTGDLAWDRDATHTDDPNTYFPVEELNRLVAARQLGRLAQHFYCLPTSYSKRRAIEEDVPAIVNSCLTDEVDVALLVPL